VIVEQRLGQKIVREVGYVLKSSRENVSARRTPPMITRRPCDRNRRRWTGARRRAPREASFPHRARPAARRKIRRDHRRWKRDRRPRRIPAAGSGRGSGGTGRSPRRVPGVPELFDRGFRQRQRQASRVTKFVIWAVRFRLPACLACGDRQGGQDLRIRTPGAVVMFTSASAAAGGINLSPNKPPGNLIPHCFCSDGHVKAAMRRW